MTETTEKKLIAAGYGGALELHEAAKWLRYSHAISVEPVSTTPKGVARIYRAFVNSNVTAEGTEADSYEMALELGILYALKKLL